MPWVLLDNKINDNVLINTSYKFRTIIRLGLSHKCCNLIYNYKILMFLESLGLAVGCEDCSLVDCRGTSVKGLKK